MKISHWAFPFVAEIPAAVRKIRHALIARGVWARLWTNDARVRFMLITGIFSELNNRAGRTSAIRKKSSKRSFGPPSKRPPGYAAKTHAFFKRRWNSNDVRLRQGFPNLLKLANRPHRPLGVSAAKAFRAYHLKFCIQPAAPNPRLISPMTLRSFPAENEAAYIRLYPVLDALSLLFLQPEMPGAADALVDAGDSLLDEQGISAETRERIGVIVPPKDIEISQAYTRLFLGSGDKTIPLCESVWTSPQHLLCQGCDLECRKIYAEAGLELKSGPVVPEDHLGLMLAYLAVISMRANAPKGLEFYTDHTAKFVPNFVEAIYNMGDKAGPYLGIAAMLMAVHELLTPKAA